MVTAPLLLSLLVFANPVWAHEMSTNRGGGSGAPGSGSSSYQDRECQDLKPGEFRTVKEDGKTSTTGIPRSYRVGRDSKDPQQLNLDINIDFQPPFPENKEGESLSNKELFQKWEEGRKLYHDKAQACFQQYSGRLRDHSGNKLKVNVLSDLDNKEVPLNVVSVVKPDKRDNSTAWSSNIDCPTIIHESLHLTGLVDAYIEKDEAKTGGTKYDCRHEDVNSIMKNHWEALEEEVEINICRCNSEECSKKPEAKESKMEVGDGGAECPKNYVGTSRKMSLSAAKVMAHEAGETSVVRIKMPKEQTRPALRNGQMAAITKPRCSRGSTYMNCSQNAYRTKSDGGCLETSPECSTPGWSK